MEAGYNIGRLATLAGVKALTVRYYEKAGLLKTPARLRNGYRRYTQKDLETLVFIRHCRAHGFTLDEIRELLTLREAPDADCSAVDALLDRHIVKLDSLLESIGSLRDQLTDLRGRCLSFGKVSECGIMKGLTDRSFCPCGPLDQEVDGQGLPELLGMPEDAPGKGRKPGSGSNGKTVKASPSGKASPPARP
jgi:DNA-binding transcriptional MerR regulator